jgi:dUTP pyrophosphatase
MNFELVLQTLLPDDSPLPSYGTPGSVGLDFPLQEDIYIPPQSTVKTDLGFIVQWPEGVYGIIVPRSSTGKKGIVLANTVGVIDSDYSGPTDTIKCIFRNTTDEPVYFSRGDRLVQLLLLPVIKPEQFSIDFYDNVEEIEGESRGGFGSTGQ